MNPKPINKILNRYYLFIIFFVFIVGVIATYFTYTIVSKRSKDILLKNVATIAYSLDYKNIESLAGNESDLTNPEYITLKKRFTMMKIVNEDVRFIYLWKYHSIDNGLYFILDSEPESSNDYSPPGQKYDEATDLDILVAKGDLKSGIEFSSDRWGSWLTALVPIKNANNEIVSILGMDMSTKTYNNTIITYTSIPIISTIFVLILITIALYLRKKEKEYFEFKEKLLAIATHDLRSPLTAISWLTESMLLDKSKYNKETLLNLEQVNKKVSTLLLTVNSFLESKKIK